VVQIPQLLKTLGVVGLIGLAALQIMVIVSRDVAYVDFEVGMRFPYEVAGLPEHDPHGGCLVAFVVSATCPACQRLAAQYSESTGNVEAKPFWMLDDDAHGLDAWSRNHELPRDRVLGLGPLVRAPWQRPITGSVWFTPTRVILEGGTLELIDLRPSDAYPTESELTTLCSDGGVAINNFAEAERLLGEEG